MDASSKLSAKRIRHGTARAKIPDGFEDWMDGYCSFFADLPDGAWQAACEGAVEEYNKEYKTKIDPYDGWIYWVSKR